MSKEHATISLSTKTNKGKIMTKQRIQVIGQGIGVMWATTTLVLALVHRFVAPLPSWITDFVFISSLLIVFEYFMRNLLRK